MLICVKSKHGCSSGMMSWTHNPPPTIIIFMCFALFLLTFSFHFTIRWCFGYLHLISSDLKMVLAAFVAHLPAFHLLSPSHLTSSPPSPSQDDYAQSVTNFYVLFCTFYHLGTRFDVTLWIFRRYFHLTSTHDLATFSSHLTPLSP